MSEWAVLDAEQTIYTATYSAAAGAVRSVLVPLRGAAGMIYSPGLGLEDAAAPLVSSWERIFLLAPSAGHTSGLAAWQARYPHAEIIAAEPARARISKVSGCEVGALEAVAERLPEDMGLHLPPVRALGETWVRIARGGRVYWLVCDAFVNGGALSGSLAVRWLKRLYRAGPGLEMTRLFVWNITDKDAFRAWVAERLVNGAADALVPCHGDVDLSQDIGERLLALVEARCR